VFGGKPAAMKRSSPQTSLVRKRWEHFSHLADIGVRGIGATKEEAFEQAALGLTAVITDVNSLEPHSVVQVFCEAPDDELLFVDWLNAIVYEMATRKMLFCRFEVRIDRDHLQGTLWGQQVEVARHEPATEIKGATYSELSVKREIDGAWIAQCIVDV
jgi:SHS2 domain-containing protein